MSGNVTYDGQVIADGNIRLNPTGETPGPGGSAKISGGKYEIPRSAGMFAGSYSVSITATRPATPQEAARIGSVGGDKDPEELDEEDDEDEEGGQGGTPGPPVVQYLPPKYNTESTLTADLAPGENAKDFDLDR
jgi:hypothetical protein